MVFTAQEQAYLDTQFAAAHSASDVHWLLYCGVLVFLMQAGFAMLCAGRVPAWCYSCEGVSRAAAGLF